MKLLFLVLALAAASAVEEKGHKKRGLKEALTLPYHNGLFLGGPIDLGTIDGLELKSLELILQQGLHNQLGSLSLESLGSHASLLGYASGYGSPIEIPVDTQLPFLGPTQIGSVEKASLSPQISLGSVDKSGIYLNTLPSSQITLGSVENPAGSITSLPSSQMSLGSIIKAPEISFTIPSGQLQNFEPKPVFISSPELQVSLPPHQVSSPGISLTIPSTPQVQTISVQPNAQVQAVSPPSQQPVKVYGAAPPTPQAQPTGGTLGSGSLGYTSLGNGLYALGSGSLGFTPANPQTRSQPQQQGIQIFPQANVATSSQNQIQGNVLRNQIPLPLLNPQIQYNGSPQLTQTTRYTSTPTPPQAVAWGGGIQDRIDNVEQYGGESATKPQNSQLLENLIINTENSTPSGLSSQT